MRTIGNVVSIGVLCLVMVTVWGCGPSMSPEADPGPSENQQIVSSQVAEDNENSMGNAKVQMLSPAASLIVAHGQSISINWLIEDIAEGASDGVVKLFYDRDGKFQSGDEVYFDQISVAGILAGDVQFDTSGLAAGQSYRLGAVLLGDQGVVSYSYAQGELRIGVAALGQVEPGKDQILTVGQDMAVGWQASFLPLGSSCQVFAQLDGGNEVVLDEFDSGGGATEISVNTGGLSLGQSYRIGVRIVGNSGLIAEQYAGGRVLTIGASGDISLSVDSPTDDLQIPKSGAFELSWSVANAPQDSRLAVILSQVGGSGQYVLAGDLSPQAGSALLELTDVQIGRYYIIARLEEQDTGQVLAAQVAGAVIQALDENVSVQITKPTVNVVTGIGAVSVEWVASSDNGADRLSIYMDSDDNNPANNNESLILGNLAVSDGQATVNATYWQAGEYRIVGKVLRQNAIGQWLVIQISVPSRGKIIVSTELSGNYDLGELNARPETGRVFEGSNINDQAGFEVAGLGDVDGDGLSEILIFSRFGHESTVGNAGSGYLIYGHEQSEETVYLSGIPPRLETAPVDGTILLFPMENLGAVDGNNISGAYSAIGLPDVSGDGMSDLLIGCPEAAPLTFHYATSSTHNPGDAHLPGVPLEDTDVSVTITDRYGQERDIPDNVWFWEPSHVHPQSRIHAAPWRDVGDVPFDLYIGRDPHASTPPNVPWWNPWWQVYLPGATIHVHFVSAPDPWVNDPDDNDTMTWIWVDQWQQKRGAAYIITSQRLEDHKNDVYDLNMIGSPVEDNVSDEPTEMHTRTQNIKFVWSTLGVQERSQMFTWDDRSYEWGQGQSGFGSSVSVLPDFDADGFPELLISAPLVSPHDLADPNWFFNNRPQAGMVKILGSEVRSTSIGTNVGNIAWTVGEWWYGQPYNSGPDNTTGQTNRLDILGSQAGSRLTGAAGLGGFVTTESGTEYAGGDFNGDGTPDFVVGAPGENSGAGAIYIIPVHATMGVRIAQIDLAEFNQKTIPGTDPSLDVPVLGAKFDGTVAGESWGEIVKPVGDFNNDGLADVMFSSPSFDNNRGKVILVFGTNEMLGDYTIDNISSKLGSIARGLIFVGENAGDMLGSRISTAGDVNGDRADDILLAAPMADALGRVDCGKVYLIYGRAGLIKTENLEKYVDLNNDNVTAGDDPWNVEEVGKKLDGAVFIGGQAGAQVQAVAAAGDVDGDGVGDFLLGAPFTTPYNKHFNPPTLREQAGEAYLIYGRLGTQ